VIKGYEKMLIQSGAVRIATTLHTRFALRNGSYSYVYVDHGDLICQPETNKVLVDAVGQYIRQYFHPDRTILVNVDSKASPQLTGAIAVAAEYRQIVVLPEATHREERGLKLRVRMPIEINPGDKIVIVDDVLTPNDFTALRVADLVRGHLREKFGTAENEVYLVVGLVREPDEAVPQLRDRGIEVRSLTTLGAVIRGAWPKLDSDQRQRLLDEFPTLPQDAEIRELVQT